MDDTVVIRPQHDPARSDGLDGEQEAGPHGLSAAKMRITAPEPGPGVDELAVHPGKDWLTVLAGTLVLLLGERTVVVEAGEAAEFSTMVPHAFGARGGPAEILAILDHDGQRTHLR